MIPRKLTHHDKENIVKHLQTLEGKDRRLRFGTMVNNDYIETYVNKSFNQESKWFGCEDDDKIISACHVAVCGWHAELGCSVEENYRNHKLAQAMFNRAVTWLRSRGITDVFMHCLSENAAMKHIALKNYMTVVSEQGESDANVQVAPATPFTPLVDVYADRMAMYDMMMKRNFKFWKDMVESSHT